MTSGDPNKIYRNGNASIRTSDAKTKIGRSHLAHQCCGLGTPTSMMDVVVDFSLEFFCCNRHTMMLQQELFLLQ